MKYTLQYGSDNPILRSKTTEVKDFDKNLRDLVKQMRDINLQADGLGIAAPQVGSEDRVCIVCDVVRSGKQRNIKGHKALVNPQIKNISKEQNIDMEGCLSLPGIQGEVSRYDRIEISYQDMYGKNKTAKFKGLNARIVQHELDHLDGILYIDRALRVYKTHTA